LVFLHAVSARSATTRAAERRLAWAMAAQHFSKSVRMGGSTTRLPRGRRPATARPRRGQPLRGREHELHHRVLARHGQSERRCYSPSVPASAWSPGTRSPCRRESASARRVSRHVYCAGERSATRRRDAEMLSGAPEARWVEVTTRQSRPVTLTSVVGGLSPGGTPSSPCTFSPQQKTSPVDLRAQEC